MALAPCTAYAHLKLDSSTPARGDTIREPLSRILLTFSQAVLERYTLVTVMDGAGRNVGAGRLFAPAGSPGKEYVLTLDRPLYSGVYTIRWHTAAADGHAVMDTLSFVVDAPGAGASAVPEPDHAGHAQNRDVAVIDPMYMPESSAVWILTRWLNFTALILMVGIVAFRLAVLERARNRLSITTVLDLDTAVRWLAAFVAVLALVSNGLRLWLESGSLHGTERMWDRELLSAMIFDTGWGKAWLAQTVACFGFLVAAIIRPEDRRENWLSAAAFAAIAASTPAFSGHAAAVQQMAIVPVVDDALHVITASAWLGTLTVLFFAALPIVVRSADGVRAVAALVNAFSPFALVMAILAVFTGGMNAFVHIAAISELWTTPYGRILALKIGLVIVAMTMGAYNWRVVRPNLRTDAATSQLKKSAFSEILVGALIVLVTAILVATPTP